MLQLLNGMTVYEATNKLFIWFQDNDSFEMSEDFNKVVLISENSERDIARASVSKRTRERASERECACERKNERARERPAP